MRAVIDARPALDPRRTGVGHYTQQLIRHLPHADPDSEYVAWYLHAKGLLRPRSFFSGVQRTEPQRAGLAVPRSRLRSDVVAARRAAGRVVGGVRRAARHQLPAAGDPKPRRGHGGARSRLRAAARDRAAHGRPVAPALRRLAAPGRRRAGAVELDEARPARGASGRRGPRARDPARASTWPRSRPRRPRPSTRCAASTASISRTRCSSAAWSRGRTSRPSCGRSR